MIKKLQAVLLTAVLLSTTLPVLAATETLPAGSFIINMGVSPQTVGNGLKPYGLIYTLLKTYKVQVKWVINPSKSKDGVDFIHNGVQYKGGTFIIEAGLRNTTIDSVISSWIAKGVVGAYASTAITVEVYKTLHYAPTWTLDKQNGTIAANYFINAGIPSSAHGGSSSSGWKNPSQLGACDDIFVMPHADPTWATHSNLYSWNLTHKGNIWAACHAVSVLESLTSPMGGLQMNFLSNTGLVNYNNHVNGTAPYTYQNHADATMQFMGTADNAFANGSEEIFLPLLGGGWRSTTRVGIFDNTMSDVPSISPGPAALVAYGRGFGDPNRGFVMYEAAHDHVASGTVAEQVAAQRMFFNYSFDVATEKNETFPITMNNLPSFMIPGIPVNLSFSMPGWVNLANYTITWTSSAGGSFSPNANQQNVTFTPPAYTGTSIITVSLTDGCGREIFSSQGTYMNALLASGENGLTARFDQQQAAVTLNWFNLHNEQNATLVVEKSKDGKQFSTAAVLNPLAASGKVNYNWTDKQWSEGRSFYRIRWVSASGSNSYSTIALVNIGAAADRSFQINTASTGRIRLSYLSSNAGAMQLSVMDMKGSLLRKLQTTVQKGLNQLEVDGLERYSQGQYILVAQQGDQKFVRNFILGK